VPRGPDLARLAEDVLPRDREPVQLAVHHRQARRHHLRAAWALSLAGCVEGLWDGAKDAVTTLITSNGVKCVASPGSPLDDAWTWNSPRRACQWEVQQPRSRTAARGEED
jgi:hypothetical protein